MVNDHHYHISFIAKINPVAKVKYKALSKQSWKLRSFLFYFSC